MSSLELMKILWVVSTASCVLSVIAMLVIFRSMSRSMDVLAKILHTLIVQHEAESSGKVVRLRPNGD